MEQYAVPMRARVARDGASHRLLQVLICAGALVAAGVVTIEARISLAARARPTSAATSPGAPAAASAPAVSPEQTAAETRARAAAQKALAAAMARASTLKGSADPAAAPAPQFGGAAADASPAAPTRTATATPAKAEPRPSAPPVPTAPTAAPMAPPTASSPPLSDAELKSLAVKAAQALRSGDIGGARMVLERAAGAGDATAIFALGETYDPNVLAKMHVRGLKGDAARAIQLYGQASAEGVAQARDRLNAIESPATSASN